MSELLSNMRWLCDEARMLTGIAVSYGTEACSESLLYGRAQEVRLENGVFLPEERPLADDSLFDLASLTKLFTAIAAMRLVEEGKLSLDERVGEIDPRFAHLKDVSVGDVLGFCVSLQTAGRVDDAPDRDEALRRLFAMRPCETPAIRVYSDINAMVVKYILEAKSDMAFFDLLQKEILVPAGMAETFAHVPDALRGRCVCYNYEHRIAGERFILRTDTPLGAAHDPKAAILSLGGDDLCGHAGLFSSRQDMTRLAQALLRGELLRPESLRAISVNRTGKPYPDGTHRQYLGYLCFVKHPTQRLSEVPPWMSWSSLGLSGFTGNHLSLDPEQKRFVLFLGNRAHARVSHIVPPEGGSLRDYGLTDEGIGLVRWPDGALVPSSAKYVHQKDAKLHAPIERRMRALGWLP